MEVLAWEDSCGLLAGFDIGRGFSRVWRAGVLEVEDQAMLKGWAVQRPRRGIVRYIG